MKKILVILIFILLFNSKAFGKNYYNCSIKGDSDTVNLIKKGNNYKLVFPDNKFWPFKIYQESKELLVIGEISYEEGEHREEKEDGVMLVVFSKIHKTAKSFFFENTGEVEEEIFELNCK